MRCIASGQVARRRRGGVVLSARLPPGAKRAMQTDALRSLPQSRRQQPPASGARAETVTLAAPPSAMAVAAVHAAGTGVTGGLVQHLALLRLERVLQLGGR